MTGSSIPSTIPSTEALQDGQRLRRRFILSAMITLCVIEFGTMYVIERNAPAFPAPYLLIIGVCILLLTIAPITIFMRPQAGMYILLVGAMLFPGFSGSQMPFVPTSEIPFWWNFSTIGQVFLNTEALKPLSFSPGEAIMMLTLVSLTIRGISTRDFKINRGVFFWPIVAYISVVGFGFLHGIATGGDAIMALYEVRAHSHFFIAYLIAANLITDRKHAVTLLWIIIIGVGLQSIQGSVSYIAQGGDVSDQGVLAHDDSLLLNILMFIAFITWAGKIDRRILFVALLLIPTAILAQLANQRRAAIGCFAIAFLPLLPLLYTLFEQQRKRILSFGITFAILTALYLPVAWNGEGIWALPARAIKSQVAPSERDASSDYYRLTETFDLKATRDSFPWFGYGYGKKFLQPIPLLVLTTDFLDYLPHNGVMWLWMRLGNLGFFAFMMMYANILIKGPQLLRRMHDPHLQMLGLLAILDLLMMFVYGKVDLQFANPRQMYALGTLLGALATIEQLDAKIRPVPVRESSFLALPGLIEQPTIDAAFDSDIAFDNEIAFDNTMERF